jgi:hypothetical protein
MFVVPLSAAVEGLTVQVACSGTPAQVKVAVPGKPAAELSNRA